MDSRKSSASRELDVGCEGLKRLSGSLSFYGTGVRHVKDLCSAESWSAAKQLVSDHLVQLQAATQSQHAAVYLQGLVLVLNDSAAAFPHLNPPDGTAALAQPIAAQLCLDRSTGEVLYASTSCCPGGFHSVSGSFCPCTAALALCAAKQAKAPVAGEPRSLSGLPAWAGSSVTDVLRATNTVYKALQLVPHPTCYTAGLGLDAWQYRNCVSSKQQVHFASQRGSHIPYYGNPRFSFDENKLPNIEDASEDLPNNAWFQNASVDSMELPAGFLDSSSSNPAAAVRAAAGADMSQDLRDVLLSRGIVPVAPAAALTSSSGATAAAAQETAGHGPGQSSSTSSGLQRRPKLLACAVREWLSMYAGQLIPGYKSRPKVINQAFELLIGKSGAPGRPLSALVLLLRALWEYLHVHGLGRLLAKPLKVLLAVRNTLLVGCIPLWARRAVVAQLDTWEQALLWKHAAAPLDITGSVGLVHLLKAMQEVRWLCLHHWDNAQLAALLHGAAAPEGLAPAATAGTISADQFSQPAAADARDTSADVQQQVCRSSSNGTAGALATFNLQVAAQDVKPWSVEPASLLQLRLHLLNSVGQHDGYLELAVAGGAWREAINKLLKSKERSQLLKAVDLLSRHIASVPERLSYMAKLVQLDSLGASERLEVAARLLLDLRGQLKPCEQPIKARSNLSPYDRYSGESLGFYNGTMWRSTFYSVPSAGRRNGGDDGNSLPVDVVADNMRMYTAWQSFLKLFLKAAAEALFESGRVSQQRYKEHLKKEGLLGGADGGVAPFNTPLEINGVLFEGGSRTFSSNQYPPEASSGCLRARAKTGYIEDAAVLAAYKQVVPVSHPELLALCSLDALCLATLANQVMAHFDAGGVLDTSVSLEPLRDMLAEPIVESGPEPVRIQAALEVAVYASIMTPPAGVAGVDHDQFYRTTTWQLLAIGQRRLALLVARTRFKICPSACAAAELMEVAIAAGPSDESAAVDLLLGKGLVRPPDDCDDWLLQAGAALAAASGSGGHGVIEEAMLAAGVRPPMLPPMLPLAYSDDGEYCNGEHDNGYVEAWRNFDDFTARMDELRQELEAQMELASVEVLNPVAVVAAAAADRQAARGDSPGDGSSNGGDSIQNSSLGSQIASEGGRTGGEGRVQQVVGEHDWPIELLDSQDSSRQPPAAADGQQQQQRLSVEMGADVTVMLCKAYGARRPPQQRHQPGQGAQGQSDGAASEGHGDDSMSLDTRELLGSDAAAAIELKGTASSHSKCPHLVTSAAAVAPAVAPAARPAADDPLGAHHHYGQDPMFHDFDPDDDEDDDEPWMRHMDPELAMMMEAEELHYGVRPNQRVRDLPPLQPPPRLAVAETSKGRKRRAAAGGGGGGGGGGGDDGPKDNGGNDSDRLRKRPHLGRRSSSAGRGRSGNGELKAGPERAALVADLFGIRESSNSSADRMLHIHLRRLSALQLWSVLRYAAGRGARPDSLQRLGLAAWLSDGSSQTTPAYGAGRYGQQDARHREVLHWFPVAASKDDWLRKVHDTVDRVGQLPTLVSEPFEGVTSSRFWSSLPCSNWPSFQMQEKLPYGYAPGQQHHNTPDAHLAWLIAMLTSNNSSSSSGGISAASSRDTTVPAGTSSVTQQAATRLTAADAAPCFSGEIHAAGAGPMGPAYRSEPRFSRLAQLVEAARAQLVAATQFAGPVPGCVFNDRRGGLGYYRDDGSTAATTAVQAAQQVQMDIARCSDWLQKLALLSRGTRFGLPLLQLCHALLRAGCRDACLALLPQALLPHSTNMRALQPNTCLVAALHELMPVIAKHGDVNLRVSGAITFMLITRGTLHASLIGDPAVLSGVMSWWLGLVSNLTLQSSAWSAERLKTAHNLVSNMKATGGNTAITGGDNWNQLERLLVRGVLMGLGAKLTSDSSNSSNHIHSDSGASSSLVSLTAQQGYQLLLECPEVADSHWAVKLYISRLCHGVGLAGWLSLGALFCPALATAAAVHLEGMSAEERAPPTHITAWKAARGRRSLNSNVASKARDWVCAALDWITAGLTSLQDQQQTAAAAGRNRIVASTFGGDSRNAASEIAKHRTAAELGEFIEAVCAALNAWHGPELLCLAFTVHQLSKTKVLQQQQPTAAGAAGRLSPSLLTLLQHGLLPGVGRADELSTSGCVKQGAYKDALRELIKDEELLKLLPKQTLHSLALSYWYQEGSPEALLKVNDLLLHLEGASNAQALMLPQGAGLTAVAGSRGSNFTPSPAAVATAVAAAGTALNLPPGLIGTGRTKTQSTRLGSLDTLAAAGAAAGAAALPQVHQILLQNLDLVPSKGGIEAAGMRFLQLQVHAGQGNLTAAMECIFSSGPDANSNTGDVVAIPTPGSPSLYTQMEVADTVLKLLADHNHVQCIRALTTSAPYHALTSLTMPAACVDDRGGVLLAALSPVLQKQLLRLTIWRLARKITTQTLGMYLRQDFGPKFVGTPGGGKAYANGHQPMLPSYLDPAVLQHWSNMNLGMLQNASKDLQLVVNVPAPAIVARTLLDGLQAQETGLVWCIRKYAALVLGVQLAVDLRCLISGTDRDELGTLPVFVTHLGQALKQDRGLLWAYEVFRSIPVPSKISRYIRRSAHDVHTLQRYLVKFTVSELQEYKAMCLPWVDWDFGPKAAQAQELADWLWWYMTTWPRTRSQAGGQPLMPGCMPGVPHY